ncbi:alpha/beta hydrolase [Panacibacter ginsenosidivorans]|uniref:Alpha/beta hydrolase n=1 Tax=Panacibacter ginsenosidivorans TaxID=1813871 RepID=A0A5B8V8U9_9BACT|nr:alpha/beta hydrolase [Panacibacter ginsenosidivorans]QEC66768.1 alpha/beta hydrolase [Panacibacter ginsenosidivorans]
MIVYKQYNQEQLNIQYNNRLHVPDFATYLERWDNLSSATREKHSFIKDIAYGDHPRECLDIFPSNKSNAKVFVFIHGGYWQMFDKTRFHFIAASFLPYYVTTVFINYPLAPAATMDEIVASCRKAMLWLQQNLAAYNANPNDVYIAGHSAGAHLAAMLLSKQWANEMQPFIKGIFLLSGLFKLLPILLSERNDVLQMSKEMAARNSPVELIPAQNYPLLIAVGAAETDEFKDQSRDMYNKCINKTSSVELLQLQELNHFSILDALADENTLLHRAIVKLMEK